MKKYLGKLIKQTIYTIEDLKPHPLRGVMVQTVTGNLVEVSSAVRIEIFNGIKPPTLYQLFYIIQSKITQ